MFGLSTELITKGNLSTVKRSMGSIDKIKHLFLLPTQHHSSLSFEFAAENSF